VVPVLGLVPDVLVNPRQVLNGLAAVPAALALTGHGPLDTPKFLLRLAVELRRFDFLAITCHEEGLQAEVEANSRIGRRLRINVGDIADEHDVPSARLTTESDSLDAALYRAVHLEGGAS